MSKVRVGLSVVVVGLASAFAAAPASADVTASLVGTTLTLTGTAEEEYASVEDGSCVGDGVGGCNYPVEVNPGSNSNPILAGTGCTAYSNYVTCGSNVNAITRVEANMGAGNDTFRLWPSEGWLENYTSLAHGGDGDDFLAGRDGVDELHGDGGNDTFEGNVGNDTMYGGEGKDKFDGWTTDNADMASGDDTIYAGPDDDELHSPLYSTGDGKDVFDGEGGSDMVSYGNRSVDVALSLDNVANDGTDTDSNGTGEEQDNALNVERAVGGHGNDFVQGGPGPNVLQGQAGDDVIDSRDGAGGDQVFCDVYGYGADAAFIDGGDTTDSFCDVITTSQAGAGGGGGGNGTPPPGGGGTPPPGGDPQAGTTPQVDVAAARTLAVSRFLRGLAAAADRAGTFTSVFTINARDARKLSLARSVKFASGKATLSGPGATKIKPKLTAKGKKALRRIRKGRRVKVTIKTTFTPLSGSKVTTKDVVTLKK